MANIEEAIAIWGALRSILENQFSFAGVKEVVGLAGLQGPALASVHQNDERRASKGDLMTVIDRVYFALDSKMQCRASRILIEEIRKRTPEAMVDLDGYLRRLGWTLQHGSLIPLMILDPADLDALPAEAHEDLIKAAVRLRDGDLSGAMAAACGAVDTVTSKVFHEENLGDPTKASFQERVVKSLRVRGCIPSLGAELQHLGWSADDTAQFERNLVQSLNQAGYVMQTLRSKMGDAHGSKGAIPALAFDSLRWAELIVRLLRVT